MELDWVLWVRTLISLGIVIALAVIVLRYGIPYLSGMSGQLQRRSAQRIEVLEVRSLDRQHRLALVRAKDRQMLLGLGGGQVTALFSWPSPDSVTAADDETQKS